MNDVRCQGLLRHFKLKNRIMIPACTFIVHKRWGDVQWILCTLQTLS